MKSLYWLILYKLNLIDILRVTNQAMKTVEGWSGGGADVLRIGR